MIKYFKTHTLVTEHRISADGAAFVHLSAFLGKGNVAGEPRERGRVIQSRQYSPGLLITPFTIHTRVLKT